MTYYRIQDFTPTDLLDGPQVSVSYIDESERAGKSVCDSPEELATYLAQTGIPFDETFTLVELEGYDSEDEDEDAHLGARLIHPTRIVSATPIADGFMDMIFAAYDALHEAA